MTAAEHILEEIRAAQIKASLLGKKCWYVSCGGSAGYIFQLALGRKMLRPRELRNRAHTEEYRRYDGEIGLLVWCSWRLEDARGPVTSSDDETKGLEDGLERLAGRTVCSAETGPGWNLQLVFTGGMVLSVFPDHVGPAASFDGNWEVWRPADAYLIGTDLSCEVIARDYPLVEQGKQGGGRKTARRRGNKATAGIRRQGPRVVRTPKWRSATPRKQVAGRR